MTRAYLVLSSDEIRAKAIDWIRRLPDWSRIEFKKPRRSLDQNSKMWAMLTEIATQLTWHGQRYAPDDWKDYFMHALRKARWMPSEEGGMVPIGMHTSDLTTEEFSDLLEIITEFGTRNGVKFSANTEGGGDGRRPQRNSREDES